jgi:hypothetical protein
MPEANRAGIGLDCACSLGPLALESSERSKAITAAALRLAKALNAELPARTAFERNTQASILAYFSQRAQTSDEGLRWFDDAIEWICEALQDSNDEPRALWVTIVNRETGYSRRRKDKTR